MNTLKTIILLLLVVFVQSANAVIVGGKEVGWSVDFDQIQPEKKTRFGWSDEEVRTKFKKMPGATQYFTDRNDRGSFTSRVIAMYGTKAKGPAFFSIVELFDASTIEDVKKLHFSVMSGAPGYSSPKCVKNNKGAESCEVWIHNQTPARKYFARFYEWRVGDRTFVLTVRNAQAEPDQKIPEEAMDVIISLITIL